MAEKKDEGFLTYKGRPLVRCGNTLYYGNMSDPFVIMMQITETKTLKDIEIADRVIVQLISTDPDARLRDRIIKKGEKRGLYIAMDIGTTWLERALEKGA